MTGNRSLDEFAATARTADPEETGEETDADDASRGERLGGGSVSDIDPVESTYDWTPGGAPCARCGSSVEERWRSDDGLVCPECKVW